MAATPDTAYAKTADAFNEVATLAGKATLADLQVALAAAQAALTARTGERDQARATAVSLQTRIDDAKTKMAALNTADASEDQARAAALAALG